MRITKTAVLCAAFSSSLVACGGDGTTGSTGTTGTTGTTDLGVDMNVVDMGPIDPCASAPSSITVSSNITADTTWCAGQTVTMTSRIYVQNSTLTIQPGVTVKGQLGSALVITRTAHIDAQGTASQPIVFTSSNAAGSRAPADWGGLVMFGNAPVNAGTDIVFEGLTAAPENTYGGTDATWNCGTLKYVRVEFGGEVFAPNKEFNGITFAGCGSQTTASYVQTLWSADDGIEFFGGSPNVDHAVIVGSDDDGLDYDNGFSGHIQYYIVHQLSNIGDCAIEADNNAVGTTAAPVSQPFIYNSTFIGGGAGAAKQQKVLLRRAALGFVRNSIFQQFRGGMAIEPPTTTNEANYANHWPTDLVFEHDYFANVAWPATTATNPGDLPQVDPACQPSGMTMCPKDTSIQQSFPLQANFSDAARGNTSTTTDLITVGAGSLPNYCPATGEAGVTGATAPAGFPNFDSAGLAFAGACAPGTDPASAWYAGWTNFANN